MEKCKYTGPTMLVGENGEIVLSRGIEVLAEVNVNIATIKTLKDYLYKADVELKAGVYVAAKYLEPVKSESIHFDPKGDVIADNLFDKLWGEIGKANAEHKFSFFHKCCADEWKSMLDKRWSEKYSKPSDETLDNIRKAARDANDSHEVGGNHYKVAIEPWDFIYANHIPFDESCIIKYACRHRQKNGVEDIKKIISYAKHILKTQYGVDKD